MTISSIDRIVKKGIKSLKNSLWEYWPAAGQNEIAERNVSIHIAHQLIRSGWKVSAESSFPHKANRRVDLLAIQIEKKAFVVCESKLLHDSTKAASLAKDGKRILTFHLSDEHESPPPISYRFGLLLALTWNPKVAKWWVTHPTHMSHPEQNSGHGWESLGKFMDDHKAKCRASRLYRYRDENKKFQEHWVIYAIFKLPD
jgi:hypothetical protein